MSVTLRVGEPADAEAIAAIYEPYVSGSAISFEEVPPDGTQIAARMAADAARWPWWVAVERDSVVGYAYGSPHRSRAAYRWSVDVSIYLAASHRQRGLGTELYQTLLSDLRRLGYVNAYAGITLPNAASVRLHERVGFQAVGVYRNVGYKHGQWHDVGWWHLQLAEPPPLASGTRCLAARPAPLMTTDCQHNSPHDQERLDVASRHELSLDQGGP